MHPSQQQQHHHQQQQRYQYSRRPEQPFAKAFPPLPASEQRALRAEALAAFRALFPAVEAAVQTMADSDCGSVNGSKSLAMWTSSVVFGTIEEVAELYMGGGRVPLVGAGYLRSKRLYALEEPDKDAPFRCSALRWSLWKEASGLTDARDLCFIEHMDAFEDSASGRRGWARAGKSVHHLSCPASQHPDGPVRTTLLLFGTILRETDRFGVLECVTFVDVDTRGSAAWVAKELVAAAKKSAHALNHALRVMRVFHERYPRLPHNDSASVHSIEWSKARHPSDASSSNGGDDSSSSRSGSSTSRQCRTCDEHISKWTPAKRCRFCDALLCKRCVEMRFQDEDITSKNYRMCLSCSVHKASGRGGDDGDANNRQRIRVDTIGSSSSSAATRDRRREKPPSFASSKGSSGDSVCSGGRPHSISTRSVETESVGSGPKDGVASATELLEQLELPASPSGSTSSSSYSGSGRRRVPLSHRSDSANSSTGSGFAASRVASRARRPSLALALELEAPRAEPVDLSYLSMLVTPRHAPAEDVAI